MKRFKDIHKGQKAILFGTGPTVKDYTPRNDEYIKIGCNEIVHIEWVDILDYYFLGDPGGKAKGYLKNPKIYQDYKPRLQKFFREKSGVVSGIPVDESFNAMYYQVTCRRNGGTFQTDFSEGVFGFATIMAEMLQFGYYTGIREFYLVGVDCNYSNGSFHSPKAIEGAKYQLEVWKKVKVWQREFGFKVFSVNPVGLQMFNEKTL